MNHFSQDCNGISERVCHSRPICASRTDQEDSKFHYILHHNLPHVPAEYDRNCEEALYRLYSFKSPRDDDDPPQVTNKLMFPPKHQDDTSLGDSTSHVLDARSAPGFWARLPRPKSLPSFLASQDFDYFVEQYRKSGFAGGLKWYQVMDVNWSRTRHLQGSKIQQPALYLVGAEDRSVLANHGGLANVLQGMKQNCLNLVDCLVLPDTGHWIQQERHEQVNDALLQFLAKVWKESERGASKL